MALPPYIIDANPFAQSFNALGQGVDQLGAAMGQARKREQGQMVTNALASGDYAGAMRATDSPELALNIRQQQSQAARYGQQDANAQRDRIGKFAMAASQLPAGPGRDAAFQRVLSMHPDSKSLPPEYLDPARGLDMIAAEFGQFRNPLDDEIKRESLATSRSQRGLIDAKARALGQPTGQERQRNWAMSKDGRVYDADADDASVIKVNDSGFNLQDAFEEAEKSWEPKTGPVDQSKPPNFADPMSFRFVDGKSLRKWQNDDNINKEAVAKQKAADIARFNEEADIQARGRYLYPKALQPGQKFTKDMEVVSIAGSKSSATAETMQKRVAAAKSSVGGAYKLLEDQFLGQRDVQKYFDAGEVGQAYADIEIGVRSAVNAISGATVTNKEFDGYIRKFVPSYGDTSARIKMKRERFETLLESLASKAAAKGILKDSDVADAMNEVDAAYQKRQTQAKQPQQVDPNKARLINKYGLE